jgi:hypothetical protein
MTAERPVIRCECWAWKHNLVGDHHDHAAEYRAMKADERVPDADWFAAFLAPGGIVTNSETARP